MSTRLGISQSLIAQYINGTKKPSKERERIALRLSVYRLVGLVAAHLADGVL